MSKTANNELVSRSFRIITVQRPTQLSSNWKNTEIRTLWNTAYAHLLHVYWRRCGQHNEIVNDQELFRPLAGVTGSDVTVWFFYPKVV